MEPKQRKNRKEGGSPPRGTKPKAKKIDPLEPLKLEIAAELGLREQVEKLGWHSLSAKDAGRIGGLITQRRKRGEYPPVAREVNRNN